MTAIGRKRQETQRRKKKRGDEGKVQRGIMEVLSS